MDEINFKLKYSVISSLENVIDLINIQPFLNTNNLGVIRQSTS